MRPRPEPSRSENVSKDIEETGWRESVRCSFQMNGSGGCRMDGNEEGDRLRSRMAG